MKQVITMIICIFILLFGGIMEIKFLDKSATYLSSEMDYIKNAIENNNIEQAINQINDSYDSWQKSKNIWNIFILHDEVDDIDEAMVELKEYTKNENTEESIVALEKIKNDLEHSVRMQKVRIDNIL